MNEVCAATRSGGLTDRSTAWILAAICTVAYLAALWVTKAAGIEALRPDTASYLYFDPSRSIGYPAFLWVVRTLTGTAALAVPLQMLLLAASLFLLGWSFHCLVRQPALSLIFQLLVLCSPELWKSSASLVTEAVATACVALWCAQLLRLLDNAGMGGVGRLSLISAVAVLVRPSLLPLFLATAVISLLFLPKKQRWWGVGLVGAGFLLAWGATPATLYMLYGSTATGSPVARGVLQHTLYCAPRDMPQEPDAAFVEENAAAVRQYIDTAPPRVQAVLRQLYSGELRFGLIIPVLGRRHGLQAGWQTDPIIMTIAKQRVTSNPGCYANSALLTYYRLSTYDTSGAPEQVAQIKKFLAAHPPVEVPAAPLLPVEQQLGHKAAAELNVAEPALPGRRIYEPPKRKPLILIFGARALHSTAAMIGILSVLLLPFRRNFGPGERQFISAMVPLGLVYHGVLALTALVELPLMRYTVPVWPVVCTLLGLCGAALYQKLRTTRVAFSVGKEAISGTAG